MKKAKGASANLEVLATDLFEQHEMSNSGPYLLHNITDKVRRYLKESGQELGESAVKILAAAVESKVHAKYETRPGFSYTIYREPSFFSKLIK